MKMLVISIEISVEKNAYSLRSYRKCVHGDLKNTSKGVYRDNIYLNSGPEIPEF